MSLFCSLDSEEDFKRRPRGTRPRNPNGIAEEESASKSSESQRKAGTRVAFGGDEKKDEDENYIEVEKDGVEKLKHKGKIPPPETSRKDDVPLKKEDKTKIYEPIRIGESFKASVIHSYLNK